MAKAKRIYKITWLVILLVGLAMSVLPADFVTKPTWLVPRVTCPVAAVFGLLWLVSVLLRKRRESRGDGQLHLNEQILPGGGE